MPRTVKQVQSATTAPKDIANSSSSKSVAASKDIPSNPSSRENVIPNNEASHTNVALENITNNEISHTSPVFKNTINNEASHTNAVLENITNNETSQTKAVSTPIKESSINTPTTQSNPEGINPPAPTYSKPETFTKNKQKTFPIPQTNQDWIDLIPQSRLSGMSLNLAANCALDKVEQQHLSLLLDPGQKAFLNPRIQQRLCEGLSNILTSKVQISITCGSNGAPTPAQLAKAQREEKQQKAEITIDNDPNIQAFQEQFGAALRRETIKPVN